LLFSNSRLLLFLLLVSHSRDSSSSTKKKLDRKKRRRKTTTIQSLASREILPFFSYFFLSARVVRVPAFSRREKVTSDVFSIAAATPGKKVAEKSRHKKK